MLGILFIPFLGLNKLKIINSSYTAWPLFMSLIFNNMDQNLFTQHSFLSRKLWSIISVLGFWKFLFRDPKNDEKKEMKNEKNIHRVKKQTNTLIPFNTNVLSYMHFTGHGKIVVKTRKQLVRGHRCFVTKWENEAKGKFSVFVSLSPYKSSPKKHS